MRNLKVNIKDKGTKLVIISYEDDIKVSLKELIANGLIREGQCILDLPETKLKLIVERYKNKRIPKIDRDLGGGKHVSHQL